MNKEELRKEAEELVSTEEQPDVKEEINEEMPPEQMDELTQPEEDELEEKNKLKQPVKKTPRKKVDKSKEKIDELADQLKRQLAEFENFRKRTEVEKAARFDMGAKSVIERVLPIVDNFERGLEGVSGDIEENSFVDGMNKVYKQLMTELQTIGVEAILAIGEEFDPKLHNAVMQVESDEYEAGFVAQELLKGYKYKNSVVRHSMVAVVN